MQRAERSGQSLTHRDTCIVKGMLQRGDRQHDIAAYFGVNGGRIAEVANGTNAYPNAQALSVEELPPPGPYLTKYALSSVIETLNEAIEALNLVEAEETEADIRTALILAKETLQNKIEALQEA